MQLKKITTPVDKKVIELKEWLTAGEVRSIQSVLLADAKFNTTNQDFALSGDMLGKMQDEQIKNVVVSVDGSSDDVLTKCLAMRQKDFEFIMAEVEKVVNPTDVKKK
ncbi:MAG: hypothetical protein GY781_13825 [Gammaproteobacteria bacterium]|nr:hypothetical protein [Gammaproteobacteria bacterium]